MTPNYKGLPHSRAYLAYRAEHKGTQESTQYSFLACPKQSPIFAPCEGTTVLPQLLYGINFKILRGFRIYLVNKQTLQQCKIHREAS